MKWDKDMEELDNMLNIIEDEIDYHRETNPDFDEDQTRTDIAAAGIEMLIIDDED